jgi:hypothetical protein
MGITKNLSKDVKRKYKNLLFIYLLFHHKTGKIPLYIMIHQW